MPENKILILNNDNNRFLSPSHSAVMDNERGCSPSTPDENEHVSFQGFSGSSKTIYQKHCTNIQNGRRFLYCNLCFLFFPFNIWANCKKSTPEIRGDLTELHRQSTQIDRFRTLHVNTCIILAGPSLLLWRLSITSSSRIALGRETSIQSYPSHLVAGSNSWK